MTRTTAQAWWTWRNSALRGDMLWLEDTTFVAADYFQPPTPSNYQPHAWNRIAVPPAVSSSHARGLIYKRVPGKTVDAQYNAAQAELESQGFGRRKRVKTKSVWGLHDYDPEQRFAWAIQNEIVRARAQVKTAYMQIARDNAAIRKNTPPTKRSRFEPSRLAKTPRKRHYTRWPVKPPTWETMIAECQPLIVFEIDICDIDEAAFWEQEKAKADEQARRAKSKRPKRVRIVVEATPLSPVSETSQELNRVSTKYQPMYTAPSKRWAAASEQQFTMTATPAGVANEDEEGDGAPLEITNPRGHFRVPSSSLSSSSTTPSASRDDTQAPVEITNPRGHFRVPSSSLSSSSTTSRHDTQDPVEVTNERGRFRVPSASLSSSSPTTTASDRKRKAQNEHIDERSPVRRRHGQSSPSRHNTDPAIVAVFDQPVPSVHTEPEHETKRRVSLDNARRSDRAAQMTYFKKVCSWLSTPFSGRRRSYTEAMGEQDGEDEPPRTRRRHTLDVDVGRNPDIFGQRGSQEQEPPLDRGILEILEYGMNPVGSGGARDIDDRDANLLNGTATRAARERSPWDVPSEFSMAREALFPDTETAPDASTHSPAQKRATLDWKAVPNIDDEIRGLLDRRAALVFGEDDHGNPVSPDGDETEPFDEDVLDRIMTVLEPDEDEDLTVGDLEVDTPAPNPPASVPHMADVPTSTEVAASREPLDNSEHDDNKPCTVEHAVVIDTPIVEELAAPSQPAGVSDGASHAASIIEPVDSSEHDDVKPITVEHADLIDTPIAAELAATPQPASVSDGDSHAATIIEPLDASETNVEVTTVETATVIDTPMSKELAATSQSAEAPGDDSLAATTLELTTTGDATIPDEPATMSQSAEATGQNLDAHTPDAPMPDAHVVEKQPVATVESQSLNGASPEPAVQLQIVEAQDDDSQLEELRGFLRRAQMKPKQTWYSGSPSAKIDTSTALKSPRPPLGQKDSNMSPITNKLNMSGSPGKKRKLKEADEAPLDMTKTSRLVKPDLDDTTPQPLRKRRRKGAENDSPDEIFNPDMALSQSLTQKGSSGGPRRSKRVATTQPTEPRTPSHFPVRLPGSFDADMPAVSTVGLMQRKTEKDLATLTRTNTRRNKGAALPVSARLAGLSMPADTADPFISPEKASRLQASRPGKAVRWDSTLARFQGDEDSAPPTAPAAAAVSPVSAAVTPPVVEHPTTPEPGPATASVPTPVPASAPASFAPSAPVESEKKKALRPRPSRLPAAVPKTTAPKIAKTPVSKTPKTPKTQAAAATPSRVTPTPKRRSSAVGSRLGTPAARRRGSAKK